MKYTINYQNSASQTTCNSNTTVTELRAMACDWNKSFEGIDRMVSIDIHETFLPGCTHRKIMI